MNREKVKKDAREDGQRFRWENPEVDCSEPNPSGGWTDALLSAATCTELCHEYGISTHCVETNGSICEECADDDQWSEFLDTWETEAQRGWEDSKDE
jgi:hypothetical protein